MGKLSRNKGNKFERKVAALLAKTVGATKRDIYRTPLSGGHPYGDRGDLTIVPTFRKRLPLVVECKHNRLFKIDFLFKGRALEAGWLRQVLRASAGFGHPLLVMMGNNTPVYCAHRLATMANGYRHLRFETWYVMRFSDFLKAIKKTKFPPVSV